MTDRRSNEEIRADLLKTVRAAKKRLKAEFGATSADARKHASKLAGTLWEHATKTLGIARDAAAGMMINLGVVDKKGNLTPEFGGEPVKTKPKKKKRK